MKRKFVIIATLFGSICISMCGCEETLTAEKAWENMNAALVGKHATHANVFMDIQDNSNNSTVQISGETYLGANNADTYSEITTYFAQNNQSLSTEAEMYKILEGDILQTYIYDKEGGKWTYQEEKYVPAPAESGDFLSQVPATEFCSDMTLEWNTVLVELHEAYVLRLNLTGDDIQTLLEAQTENLLNYSALGISNTDNLNIPVVYYLDTDTFLPLKMEMSFDETSGLFADFNMKYNAKLSTTVFSYDPQEIPSLPEEAKEYLSNAENAEDTTEEETATADAQ